MKAKPWPLTGAMLCLAIIAGCSADDAAPALDDPAALGQQLERVWQEIEVQVYVPTGGTRFDVAGLCGLDGQTVYAEGTSRNAEFSIHVSKDANSGLAVFYSNEQDQWEMMLDAANDTSVIDERNVFRFKGLAMRNGDESNLEQLELIFRCTQV